MPLPVNETINLEGSSGGVPYHGVGCGQCTAGAVDVLMFGGGFTPGLEITNRDSTGHLWARGGASPAGDGSDVADPVEEGAGCEMIRPGETVMVRANLLAGAASAVKLLMGSDNSTGKYFARKATR